MSESEIVIRELKRKEYQAALELYRKVFFGSLKHQMIVWMKCIRAE